MTLINTFFRNIIITVVFSAFTTSIQSQDLVVTYGVSTKSLLDENQKERLSPDVKKIFNEAQENFKYITYKLKVRNRVSLFFEEEKLKNDGNKKLKIASAMAGFSGFFYSNSNKKEKIHQLNGYGQKFLITSKFNNLQWEIAKESKLLNGFKTFKATAIETYFDGKENKQWQIVAWFTPEINIPFGPGGYGNLPGLILELHKGSKTYFVKNIKSLSLNATEVSKPTVGKLITRDEFDEIGRKMTKKLEEF